MRAALLLLPSILAAQSVRLYSEFRRIDPFGKVVAVDAGGNPREILSPAVARNAWASYHVAVTLPPGKAFELYVQQNPDNVVQPVLYREVPENSVPDKLEPVALPAGGTSSYAKPVFCYWLDLFVPARVTPGRIRVEVQLFADERWIIYPVELRIQSATVPEWKLTNAALPAALERSDTAVLGPWRAAYCGTPETPEPVGNLTIRGLIRRNALQDVALAAGRSKEDWCGAAQRDNPEWYLRVRDRLLKE
jgi:hypothetical protein